MTVSRTTPVTAEEFDQLFRALSNWGRWGPEDQRGTLNHLTPERVTAAAGLARDGVSVTLSLPVNTRAAANNPKPADHSMTELGPPDTSPHSVQFLKDYVGADYHNDGHSHIDALCHVAYEGRMYNGRSAGAVTRDGAADAKAGLHPTAMAFIGERSVAALGSDGNSDTAPSSTDGVDFPIHVLAIAAMGVHLLDYLQFEDLRAVCESKGRWEFLFAASPLRIVGGTGSPINPTAVF